jgi:4-diphosphocytidyl-2-C-methyl-D-erythritol kinase
MRLDSCSKLNLYLKVLHRNKDGYHDIDTIFERISLSDKIIFTLRKDSNIKIVTSSDNIPSDHTNLAYRAAKLLQEKYRIKNGVNIKIIKRIPVGAGLGGGSGNAATVLIALNKLWKLGLSKAKLSRIAECLGSDVPFFIHNTPFAQGLGRGEDIKPIKSLKNIRIWHVLVVPRINVATALVYKKWDEFFLPSASDAKSKSPGKIKKVKLTTHDSDVKILTLAIKGKIWNKLRKYSFNDLENVTFRLYPVVGKIKEELYKLKQEFVLMSGSGPTVFAITPSKKEAMVLYRQLKGKNKPWDVFLAQTV